MECPHQGDSGPSASPARWRWPAVLKIGAMFTPPSSSPSLLCLPSTLSTIGGECWWLARSTPLGLDLVRQRPVLLPRCWVVAGVACSSYQSKWLLKSHKDKASCSTDLLSSRSSTPICSLVCHSSSAPLGVLDADPIFSAPMGLV